MLPVVFEGDAGRGEEQAHLTQYLRYTVFSSV